jgi:hypothetical protein
VSFLSRRSEREVEDSREKWGDFCDKLMAIYLDLKRIWNLIDFQGHRV